MKQTSFAAHVIGYAAVLTMLLCGSAAFGQSGEVTAGESTLTFPGTLPRQTKI